MVNDARDDESGEFREKYPLEDVYAALLADAEDRDGLATARGVGERLGSSRVTAHRKLETLADDGHATKTNISGRVVWRPTDISPTFDDDASDETETADETEPETEIGDEQDEQSEHVGSWRDDRLNDEDAE